MRIKKRRSTRPPRVPNSVKSQSMSERTAAVVALRTSIPIQDWPSDGVNHPGAGVVDICINPNQVVCHIVHISRTTQSKSQS